MNLQLTGGCSSGGVKMEASMAKSHRSHVGATPFGENAAGGAHRNRHAGDLPRRGDHPVDVIHPLPHFLGEVDAGDEIPGIIPDSTCGPHLEIRG